MKKVQYLSPEVIALPLNAQDVLCQSVYSPGTFEENIFNELNFEGE